jgi:hypothetical protein
MPSYENDHEGDADTVNNLVETLANTVKRLTCELATRIAHVQERHELLGKLEDLAGNNEEALTALRKRLDLIQTIRGYGTNYINDGIGDALPRASDKAKTRRLCKMLIDEYFEPTVPANAAFKVLLQHAMAPDPAS